YYELEILLKNEAYVRYLYDKGDIHFLKKFVVLHAEFLGRNEELNLDEEDTEFYRFQVKWALELEIIKRLRLSLTSIIKNQIISNLPTGDICADSDIEDLYESIKLNTKKELMEFIARTVDVYTAKSNNIFLRELKVDQKIIFEELSFNDEFNSEFYHYDFVDYSEESTILLNRENYYNEDKLIDKIFSVFQKNEI
ncbi:hypothetical protein, partial [uncultured Paenibacillus sp.]|uniref:hypothetical protein n=1 Tax=uncultured Paenibacillus sp. TaxID=227322 RepID=UPI002599CF43